MRIIYWKPIQGYPNYEVNNFGQIKRIAPCGGTNYKCTHPGKILKPINHHLGYPFVNLYVNGERKTRAIHKIVARAFLGPCPDGMVVHHKNGIKSDNRHKNLKYVTHEEHHQISAKITMADVINIRSLGGKFPQDEIGRIYGLSQTYVGAIIRGSRW